MSQVCNRHHHRKGQDQRNQQEQPAGQEFSKDGLPDCHWHGEEQFHGPQSQFFGPETHPDRRHKEEVKPGVPHEECQQISRRPLKESSHHEGKETVEEQENYDKDVGDRRGEKRAQLSLGDRPDIFHSTEGLSVSGRVIDRKTSSSRPSSTVRCSTCHFCLCASANTSGNKSPFGWSRSIVWESDSEISSAFPRKRSPASSG